MPNIVGVFYGNPYRPNFTWPDAGGEAVYLPASPWITVMDDGQRRDLDVRVAWPERYRDIWRGQEGWITSGARDIYVLDGLGRDLNTGQPTSMFYKWERRERVAQSG